MEEDDGGSFFLNGVHPASIRMKRKVSRAITGRKRDKRSSNRSQLARVLIEAIDLDPVLPKIGLQHESVIRVGVDHVRVRRVMAADGKASRRGVVRMSTAQGTLVPMDIYRRAKVSIRLHG